jgi:integrase
LDTNVRIHDLRHTAVALAISAGGHPKQIQELCGHASITTTLNTYGHLFESLQEGLAERLGQTLLASKPGKLQRTQSGG